MERQNRMSRAAMIMSAAALIMSAGFAGGPALARAIASNSDKVDGLHAVKASATKAKAKGKLVATDPTTAIFPSKFIGNDVKFPAKVPAGTTLRGAWSYEDQNVGAGDYGSSIDFGAQLAGSPAFVLTSAPTANCPGSVDQPEALPGYLCMYLYGSSGFDTGTLSGISSPFGVHWHLSSSTTVGADLYARGTYAVTAAPAVIMRGVPGDGK